MQCREFEQRLNDVLDERGDPAADSGLLAHAEACKPCRTLLAGQRLLLSGLRSFPAPGLPRGFARQVLASADLSAAASSPRKASRALLAGGTLLASAAAAFLAVSLVWYARQREPGIAAAPKLESAAPLKNGKLRRQAVAGGTLALTHADRARGNWRQDEWLVEAPRLPDHLRESLDELADSLPESVQRYSEVERLAPGIRPLRLSFVLLWDTLFRALPGVSNEAPLPERSVPQPTGCSTPATADLSRLA
jgi:hypothetical protein